MKCDSCGYEMQDDKGASAIGISINLTGEHPEHDRLMKKYGKDYFNICFCCLVKAMGVK